MTPSLAAAGVRAGGTVAGALIGRYRPTGVPRLGSNEDRAEAYRRMLDASTASWSFAYHYANMRREVGRAANKLLVEQIPGAWQAATDLISALHGVRLCGTVRVIAAAEDLVTATSGIDMNEKDGARFQAQVDAVVTAQAVYLDACREDLGYAAKRWQLKRRRRERKFLAKRAQSAP